MKRVLFLRVLNLILFLFLGLFFIGSGLHNIDNAWNMERFEKISGLDFVDVTAWGIAYEPEPLYVLGHEMVLAGVFILMASLGTYAEFAKKSR